VVRSQVQAVIKQSLGILEMGHKTSWTNQQIYQILHREFFAESSLCKQNIESTPTDKKHWSAIFGVFQPSSNNLILVRNHIVVVVFIVILIIINNIDIDVIDDGAVATGVAWFSSRLSTWFLMRGWPPRRMTCRALCWPLCTLPRIRIIHCRKQCWFRSWL